MECNYDDGVKRVHHPSWGELETALRTLLSRSGRIDLWEDRENGSVLMVSGSPGTYALDVMKDDTTAAMLVSRHREDPSLVKVFGEEYRSDQTVNSIDVLVPIVKELVESGRYLETATTNWEMRQM